MATKQLSLAALQQKVLEWQPDMEAAGSQGQLASEVAASLQPAALAELDKALEKLFASGTEVSQVCGCCGRAELHISLVATPLHNSTLFLLIPADRALNPRCMLGAVLAWSGE